MHDFFEIKPSPGKGNGVFATKAISPGSTILRDVPVMQINRQQSETAEQDVQQAFNRLSKANQRKLLDLHAAEANGANAGKSKLYRIHKDNAFGEEESSFMVPTISRINHACALTATIAAAPGESAGLGVVAEKPIAAGEEVSISYKEGLLQTLTSWQRKALLRDFDLLGDDLVTRAPEDMAKFQRVFRALDVPLTLSDRMVCNYMLAKLYEAEGLSLHVVAEGYANAAAALHD